MDNRENDASSAPAVTHGAYLREETDPSRQSEQGSEYTGADILSMQLGSVIIRKENEDVISELYPWQSRNASVRGCSDNLMYWNEQVGVTDLILKQAGKLTAEQLTTAQEGLDMAEKASVRARDRGRSLIEDGKEQDRAQAGLTPAKTSQKSEG